MSDSLEPIIENPFETLKRINPSLYALFEKCAYKIVTKNHDYAGQGDFYRNFRKSEQIDIPAWKGIFVRFQDKVSRIEGFIKTGIFKVSDEGLLDTVVDAANYILLMYACYDNDIKTALRFGTSPKGSLTNSSIYNGDIKEVYYNSRKVIDQRDAP